jgi:hypothetical protein
MAQQVLCCSYRNILHFSPATVSSTCSSYLPFPTSGSCCDVFVTCQSQRVILRLIRGLYLLYSLGTNRTENTACSSSSIVAYLSGTCLPSRCLATKGTIHFTEALPGNGRRNNTDTLEGGSCEVRR